MHQIFEKYKLLFLNSKGFFKTVQKETSYWTVLKFYVVFIVASQIISVLFNLPIFLKNNLLLFAGIYGLIGAIILSFAVPFIMAGIVHLGVLILKGKNGYFNTFKPITYAMSISAFYNLISSIINGVYGWFNPISVESLVSGLAQIEQSLIIMIIGTIIGAVSLIHVLYAEISGIGFYQGLTRTKALLAAILVPVVFLIIIAFLFGFGAIFSSSMFSALQF